MINFRQAKFTASFPSFQHISIVPKACVAIAGKSNSGKSSLINALCDQKKLAKTSNTPGRTREFVFFQLAQQRYLIDLPGYGFARVARQMKQQWGVEINNFFKHSPCLNAVVLSSDCRRLLSDDDWLLIELCQHLQLPILICFTKVDKLSRAQLHRIMRQQQQSLQDFPKLCCLGVSSLKKQNVQAVADWLQSYL